LLAGSAAEAPVEAPRVRHVWFAYTVLVDERERLRDHLASHGVASRLYYNPPLHLQPAFSRLGLGPGSFPVAEATAERMLALPVHPYLLDADVERVASALLEGVAPR
jgi:dTDP-4-amino-4,6-dideoxygalactose transaminase